MTAYLVFLALFAVAWLCGYMMRGSQPHGEMPNVAACMLIGHLRDVLDTRTLRQFKHELREFDARAGAWKQERVGIHSTPLEAIKAMAEASPEAKP